MADNFPYPFGTTIDDPRLMSAALQANFLKAATKTYVDENAIPQSLLVTNGQTVMRNGGTIVGRFPPGTKILSAVSAPGVTITASYANYVGGTCTLETGREYRVDYSFDQANANSGGNRTYDIDVTLAGSSVGGVHPRTGLYSDYLAGAAPYYPVSGFAVFTAGGTSQAVQLALKASAGSAVVVKDLSILVTAL